LDTTIDPNNMPHVSDASVSVEIETEDMTLNIGPQHPSTHGVLRLVAKVDGEKISSVEPVLGYMHRGYEKLAEVRTYPQITTLVNRIDWVSGFANEIPFIAATEKLMEIEVPERAQHIRLILTEMARIASHFVFNGAYALEIGALSPMFLAMEDRERVLDLIESVTGGRFHPNFNRIGGVKPAAGAGPTTKKDIQDLPAGFYEETKIVMEKVLEAVERFENLVGGNEVFKARTQNVGIISKEMCEDYGVSGPILRASGVKFDLRTQTNFLPYDKFDFEIPIGENGDCYDRWYVRLIEMRESARIILQAIDSMPSGSLQAKVPKVIKVPKGQSYVRTENPKGEMGFHVISEGGLGPYRLKIRTPSFSNISILPELLEGQLLPDLIAIMGSLDFVLGDVDR
jgi:NADH-quinone oxidoreductase subunit D|tara:strand:- start:1183 stop:2379 length:1197 start_codon:yes stop_codon:yes gene_type:complete